MSGYLRRLVTAAMHPPRAIHAAVGSVHAPRLPAAAPALQEIAVDLETGGKMPAPTSGIRAGRREDGAPHLPRFQTDTFGADDTPLVVKREQDPRALTLRGARDRETMSPASGQDGHAEWLPGDERVAAAPLRSHRPAETIASSPTDSQLIDMPEHAAAAERENEEDLQPLIARQKIPAEFSSPTTVPGTIRPQSAGVPRPAGSLPRAEKAEEPDEIQIHIGRIEVTAVPPPVAVRPAARPERRSVNLDDYLKQRRGGNR